MITIEKTYLNNGSTYIFKFNYNEAVAEVNSDFDVLSFPGKSFGYDDPQELIFYPSGCNLVLDNLTAKNYNAFQILKRNYSRVLPYNYNSIFTIEIIKNGSQYFLGVADNLNYDFIEEELRVEIIDPISQYKSFTIDNYTLLDFLHFSGLPGRSIVTFDNNGIPGLPTRCNIWGKHARVFKDRDGKNRLWVDERLGSSIDVEFKIKQLINLFLKAIDGNTSVTFNIDWLFGRSPEYVSFSEIYGFALFQRIFGFMLQKPKSFVIDRLESEDHDTPGLVLGVFHKYPFKKVYDDGVNETWLYDVPNGTGLELRKVSDALAILERNFFAECGFTSYNKAYYRKKANYDLSTAIDITDKVIIETGGNQEVFQKETFRPAKKYVAVHDRFRDYAGNYYETRGIWGAQDSSEDKLEFDIWFSAYADVTFSGYNLFYYDGSGHRQPVLNVKDPVSGSVKTLSTMVLDSEYIWNNFTKDKYSFTLDGTDYDPLSIYKFTDETGTVIYLKPVTTDLLEDDENVRIKAINLFALL